MPGVMSMGFSADDSGVSSGMSSSLSVSGNGGTVRPSRTHWSVQITPLPEQEHGQLAREIASKGIVLLKNAGGLLPLATDELHSLAVIGGDAGHYIAGGGSAFVKPTYLVSILDGIRQHVGEGVRVDYAEGTDPVSTADLLPGPPLVPSSVLTPTGSISELHGLHAEYWTNTHFEGEPELVRIDRQVALNLGFFNFMNASLLKTPDEFNYGISVRWTGSFNVPVPITVSL